MTRFSRKLEDDLLYQALADGTADDEDQREAAEWLKALHTEHASEVERLTGEVADALKPFAAIAQHCAGEPDETVLYVHQGLMSDLPLTIGDFRKARTALQDGGKKCD